MIRRTTNRSAVLALIVVVITGSAAAQRADRPLYKNADAPIEARVEDLALYPPSLPPFSPWYPQKLNNLVKK